MPRRSTTKSRAPSGAQPAATSPSAADGDRPDKEAQPSSVLAELAQAVSWLGPRAALPAQMDTETLRLLLCELRRERPGANHPLALVNRPLANVVMYALLCAPSTDPAYRQRGRLAEHTMSWVVYAYRRIASEEYLFRATGTRLGPPILSLEEFEYEVLAAEQYYRRRLQWPVPGRTEYE